MKNQYEIDYQQGYDNANEEWLDRIDKMKVEIKKAVWEDTIISLDGTDEVSIPRLDPDDVFEIIDKYKENGG